MKKILILLAFSFLLTSCSWNKQEPQTEDPVVISGAIQEDTQEEDRETPVIDENNEDIIQEPQVDPEEVVDEPSEEEVLEPTEEDIVDDFAEELDSLFELLEGNE